LIEHLALQDADLPESVKEALSYADEVDSKIATSSPDWMKEFFEFFNSEYFCEQATTDDCERVFLTSLKGSSNLTYPLLVRLGSEYELDIDQVIKQGKINTVVADTVLSYLDICNNNLSQKTFNWLSNVSGAEIGMTVAAYDYGVFVSVPPDDEDEEKQLPEDLEVVLAYARKKNCIVVRFDRDADVVEGIPNYDW
jgi:hypothetical protein